MFGISMPYFLYDSAKMTCAEFFAVVDVGFAQSL